MDYIPGGCIRRKLVVEVSHGQAPAVVFLSKPGTDLPTDILEICSVTLSNSGKVLGEALDVAARSKHMDQHRHQPENRCWSGSEPLLIRVPALVRMMGSDGVMNLPFYPSRPRFGGG